MGKTLLVNFWYSEALGHVIEALRYCLGYKTADPTLEISVLLNGGAPKNITHLCPFIDAVYSVQVPFVGSSTDPSTAVAHVPRDWDFIVDDRRRRDQRLIATFP